MKKYVVILLIVGFCSFFFSAVLIAETQTRAIDRYTSIDDGTPTASCTGTATNCGSSVTCEGDSCEATDGENTGSCTSTSTSSSSAGGDGGGSIDETTTTITTKTATCGPSGNETNSYFLFDAFVFPETLNLKTLNKRRFVTVYIEVPSFLPSIEPSTVYLSATGDKYYAEPHPFEEGDFNGNGIPDYKMKFDLREIEDCDLMPENTSDTIITLDFEGQLSDTSPFKAKDENVRIICHKRGK